MLEIRFNLFRSFVYQKRHERVFHFYAFSFILSHRSLAISFMAVRVCLRFGLFNETWTFLEATRWSCFFCWLAGKNKNTLWALKRNCQFRFSLPFMSINWLSFFFSLFFLPPSSNNNILRHENIFKTLAIGWWKSWQGEDCCRLSESLAQHA